MRLAIPVFLPEGRITDVELRIPTPGVLSDVGRSADTGSNYVAMQILIAGSIETCTDEKGDVSRPDRSRAKVIVGRMSLQTAWQIALEVAKLIKGDGKISGAYECPECHNIVRAQKTKDVDLRDDLSDFEVSYKEDEEKGIAISIDEPVQIEREGNREVLSSVSRFVFSTPTLADYIKVNARGVEEYRELFHVMLETLLEVDGQPVEAKWKTRYGLLTMERIPYVKMRELSASFQRYGIRTRVTRHCPKCGSDFEARINAEGFFASALRQD